jgi:hypothetical protein
MKKTYLVIEVYNCGDGYYPLVMSAEPFATKRKARDHARWLARDLWKQYLMENDLKPTGEDGWAFEDVWIKVDRALEWGFDSAEDTINRDIRVVEVEG